jgi:ABC-2 type transport system ATP-binding protein
MEAILAQDIFRVYSTGHGINGICLSVPYGRCIGILGPNGSGKTTLTRLVAGLDRIDCGHLYVLGKPADGRARPLRHRCGIALETPAHWDALSGRQNLWFFGRQYGLAGAELNQRVHSLLREAGLASQADDPVATYSFGMRRKLGIIEALISDPDLLILDEPSAGADAAFLEQLIRWTHQRCESGRTTWLADNDADWLARAATHVILLSEGRIQAAGAVGDLTASIAPKQRIEIVLERACPEICSESPGLRGISSLAWEGKRVVAQVCGDEDLSVELLQWITARGGRVRSMDIRTFTLYEALMQRTVKPESKS